MLFAVFSAIATAIRLLSPGESPRFDADKSMHRLVAVLIFVVCAMMLSSSGAQPALPDEAWEVVVWQLPAALAFLALAWLGVGFPLRRDVAETLLRLGLRMPKTRNWLAGIGAGIVLFGLAHTAMMIWSHSVPADVFAAQTTYSRQLHMLLGANLLAAFALAILTATSEEILFRGALQPVFGIFITALFFTLLHPPLLGTPGALIIFGLSIGLGVFRARTHTTAAIIAHASYNFAPFLLTSLGVA